MKIRIILSVVLFVFVCNSATWSQPQTQTAPAPQTQTAPQTGTTAQTKPLRELHVSAPRTMRGVIRGIARYFERSHPGWKVEVRFTKPVEQMRFLRSASPADVFIIYDEDRQKKLLQANMVEQNTLTPIMINDVVLMCRNEVDLPWKDLKDIGSESVKKVALFPEKNAVGKKTRAMLEKQGVMESLKDKIFEAKNSKALTEAMKSGEVQCGFVFAEEAADHTSFARIVWRVPQTEIPGTVYYAGVLRRSQNKTVAREYVEALRSTIAKKLFENAGYTFLPQPKP